MKAKRLVIKPCGWPCTLAECPPGLFVVHDTLGMKCTEGWVCKFEKYEIGAYYAENGEGMVAGSYTDQIKVQPAIAEWEEYVV